MKRHTRLAWLARIDAAYTRANCGRGNLPPYLAALTERYRVGCRPLTGSAVSRKHHHRKGVRLHDSFGYHTPDSFGAAMVAETLELNCAWRSVTRLSESLLSRLRNP